MGARTILGGRPRYLREPRQHGHHNPPACHHRSFLLTCEEFDALHDAADSHCQMCGKWTTYLCIDHDHRLGKWAVRGLLCGRCNVGLGYIDRGERPTTDDADRYLANAWHLTQDTTAKQQRGFPLLRCRWCNRPAPVRKDGRFSVHVAREGGRRKCPGWGRKAPTAHGSLKPTTDIDTREG